MAKRCEGSADAETEIDDDDGACWGWGGAPTMQFAVTLWAPHAAPNPAA